MQFLEKGEPLAWVHTYAEWYIACDSRRNRTAFLYKSHAICVRCDWSHTFSMTLIAPHPHQKGAGPFFWSALKSYRMAIHTYAIRFCTSHHGIVNLTYTPAAVCMNGMRF
ncbi:unnamed protein product [Staurois parvus]|uniref:Uncharacterized protein n=1 Tax=Staurois parvus TaxID=386267 RepID=A0ABN9GQX6_9NEOB|nr:unnamed protein product [Staurois parvus]